MMAWRRFISIAGILLVACSCVAQTAVLGLDANPKNRCESTGAGSLWTLHNLQTVTITVTLQRFTGMDANPQTIVKVVGAGRYVGQQ